MNAKIWVAGTLTIVIIAFIVFSQAFHKSEVELANELVIANKELLIRAHAPTLGRSGAPVTVVEFFDPECESCREFNPVMKSFLMEYEDKIQLVMRYAPFHPNSKLAIKILEAARKQNLYWETLDALFKGQPEWGSHHAPRPELMWKFIAEVEGLNVAQVRKDLDDPVTEEIIRQDIEDGQILGIKMTPTFFVNGEPLTVFGAEPLRELIERRIENP